MGCQMLAALDRDGDSARKALAQVPTWFAEWEASLSRFRDDSELCALNRADGKPMQVSETLWQVLEAAFVAARTGDGLVTPLVLDAVQAAGYDRSFESLAASAAPADTPIYEPIGDWRAIERTAKTRTVRVPRGMRLDLVGVAKGWAADQAARRLSAFGPALVDAGGDIAISAAMGSGEAWPVAVADPFKADADLDLLMVAQGGIATSGRDYRRWQRGGKWQHHIIDPRTGAPAETDVLTATVVAPTTAKAEVAAKVALILGSLKGLQWIEARAELAGLLVLENGQIIRSRRLDNYAWTEPIASFENLVLPAWR